MKMALEMIPSGVQELETENWNKVQEGNRREQSLRVLLNL